MLWCLFLYLNYSHSIAIPEVNILCYLKNTDVVEARIEHEDRVADNHVLSAIKSHSSVPNLTESTESGIERVDAVSFLVHLIAKATLRESEFSCQIWALKPFARMRQGKLIEPAAEALKFKELNRSEYLCHA